MGVVKNRFFKNTMGYLSELAIVAAVDASDGTAATEVASTVTIPVTVSASPTEGDTIQFTFSEDGDVVLYAVPATPSTAICNAGIVAALQSAGYNVSSTGTTSQILTVSKPGADYNASTVTLVEVGTSFTTAGPYTFAGGVNGDATAADNYEDFVASGTAGTIWAFWDHTDKHTALVAGDTAKAANQDKKFFYGWKDADGTVRRSSSIPVKDLVYSSVAYNAGTAQSTAVTFAGTYSATQIVFVKIIETTGTQLPYPIYEYSVTVGSGGINTAVAALEALIDAEKYEKVFSASSSTNVLTITTADKNRSFKVFTFIETTTTAATDATAPTQTTTKNVAPIGTAADVQELFQYYIENNGGVVYGPEGVNGSEFGVPATNIVAATQYGFLVVTSKRSETGSTRDYNNKAYMTIAIVTGDVAKLAAL